MITPLLDGAERDVLTFMDFPRANRKQIASPNPLERLSAEIKRRTDVVGIFPNGASIVRLVGTLLLEQNDELQLQRRNLSLEGLGVVSGTSVKRLSARVYRLIPRPASRPSRYTTPRDAISVWYVNILQQGSLTPTGYEGNRWTDFISSISPVPNSSDIVASAAVAIPSSRNVQRSNLCVRYTP